MFTQRGSLQVVTMSDTTSLNVSPYNTAFNIKRNMKEQGILTNEQFMHKQKAEIQMANKCLKSVRF